MHRYFALAMKKNRRHPSHLGDEIPVNLANIDAGYASIDEIASWFQTTRQGAERWLRSTHRMHDLAAVASGREEVGPHRIFVTRPRGAGFTLALHSLLPQEQWTVEPGKESEDSGGPTIAPLINLVDKRNEAFEALFGELEILRAHVPANCRFLLDRLEKSVQLIDELTCATAEKGLDLKFLDAGQAIQ